MSDDDDFKRLCIPEPRCRPCQSRLEPNQIVIPIHNDNGGGSDIQQMWSNTAGLIDAFKSHARHIKRSSKSSEQESEASEIMKKYLRYTVLLDELPIWLQHPNSSPTDMTDDVASYQRICFWKAIETRLISLLGLGGRQMAWTIRKTEIIQDFLHELQTVPFVCLKVQGETALLRSFTPLRNAAPYLRQNRPIELVHLPLPPAISSRVSGACDAVANPKSTGCMPISSGRTFQSGSLLPDGSHVLALVDFIGAPPFPAPGSIYNGSQIIIIKTDNTIFANGDPWKCITCGLPIENERGRTGALDYPQAFHDGRRALAGTNIIDCGNYALASEECTPNRIHIHPLRWNTSPDGTGEGGAMRELRLHPDNVHVGFNSFTQIDGKLGQLGYFGRLEFEAAPATGLPRVPRYNVVKVTTLFNANAVQPITTQDQRLFVNPEAITVGELRGFSGRGDEFTYIGYAAESSNLDIFAVGLQTGRVRRITAHPENVDPIDTSPDGKWWTIMDTRGTGRQMFLSGMRHIPPVTDLVSSSVTSATRNNGQRRFFLPYLLDNDGDRGSYYGQKINGEGFDTLGSGSLNDPQWNGQADPRWSPDSTKLVYWEAQAVSPMCGDTNPLPCYPSKEPDGKDVRLVLAKFTKRSPSTVTAVETVSDDIPWGVKYVPGSKPAAQPQPEAGTYTLFAKYSGYATVIITKPSNATFITGVSAAYNGYSDDGSVFLNGFENVTNIALTPTLNAIDWFSDLVQTGPDLEATKRTSSDGFHLQIDVFTNLFNATGTLTTTINGKAHLQPLNGT
ncbi:hypothetical protein HJFPF1_05228 [Paramyrothecium foliicola]|nr:hypothetical protein HJFPF1_05228 [Paramyrothecium foliicola]